MKTRQYKSKTPAKHPKKPLRTAPGTKIIDRANKNIPIEDLIEYRRKGLTLEEIGRLTNSSKQNVAKRLQDANLESLSAFRDNKDVILEYHQRRVSNALTDSDIQKMSGLQKLIGLKLTDEAIRTIRGQANEIVEVRSITASLDDVWDRWERARKDRLPEGGAGVE